VRILIAEDEPVSRRLLQSVLTKWGYDVVVTSDGTQAWEALQQENPPLLVILDWMMPGLNGPQICRMARHLPKTQSTYIILLTAKGEKDDIVRGLAAGANDYVTKPFDSEELQARVQVGVRMVELQLRLETHVKELQEALSHVNQLQGIIPICCNCKKIRDDQNYWQRVEHYIARNAEAQFSHGICPDCYVQVFRPQLEKRRQQKKLCQSDRPDESAA
jgi:phosphoserine phosphatase RsbU/P